MSEHELPIIQRADREFVPYENPAMPGHGQLRRAFFGWQWRVSVKGEMFSPWLFTFTRRRALRKLAWFSPVFIEEEQEP